MKAVNFTEFRKNASLLLSQVEQGQTIRVIRHGKAIADISPPNENSYSVASWQKKRVRLTIAGDSLANLILQERDISQ